MASSSSTRGGARKEKSPPKNPIDRSTKEYQLKVDENYARWKGVIHLLYDWISNHSLVRRSLSCRWGPQLETGVYKNRQRLYISEQADGSLPNTLVVANCQIVKQGAPDQCKSEFNEHSASPNVSKYKTIIHPGEVSRIKVLPQDKDIVATHSDTPDVYIWDIESQKNRHLVQGADPSRPNLILIGHQENAEFALAMSTTDPYVLSGGKDRSVILWSIQDHLSETAASSSTSKTPASKISASKENGKSPHVGPRGIYEGHTDTVKDVTFNPRSSQEFCSVGDDSCLILWDARIGNIPAVQVKRAHDGSINSVDWNPFEENYIVTGSADYSARVFDRRNLTSGGLGSAAYIFKGHQDIVRSVQWSPHSITVFGSGGDDCMLNLWDVSKVGKTKEKDKRDEGLLFQHVAHRDKVVDFEWNEEDPWTIASVSEDYYTRRGGGRLQIWRMTDMLYRPEDELIEEVEAEW